MIQTLDFISKVEFDCLCGGKAAVGQTTDGRSAVTHAFPFCKLFDNNEPTEYLRAINAADVPARGNA